MSALDSSTQNDDDDDVVTRRILHGLVPLGGAAIAAADGGDDADGVKFRRRRPRKRQMSTELNDVNLDEYLRSDAINEYVTNNSSAPLSAKHRRRQTASLLKQHWSL